ncbi:hypothetical protein YPPY88_4079 [Yersinia pestis PY-88]|nr:hypothetical protein YPPY88_4079 [Yersinia pestis PY-88]
MAKFTNKIITKLPNEFFDGSIKPILSPPTNLDGSRLNNQSTLYIRDGDFINTG